MGKGPSARSSSLDSSLDVATLSKGRRQSHLVRERDKPCRGARVGTHIQVEVSASGGRSRKDRGLDRVLDIDRGLDQGLDRVFDKDRGLDKGLDRVLDKDRGLHRGLDL